MVFRGEQLERVLRLRQRAEGAAERLPPLLAQAEKAVTSILHGEHAQRKSGTGEKFWQFKEYTPFDRPQDIDWRQSAKTERIFIRQKERQTNQTMLFWVSNEPGMHFSSNPDLQQKQRSASVLALALALLFKRGGEQVGLIGQSKTGSSEITLESMAHDLSDVNYQMPEFNALKDMPIKRNSGLMLMGDFLQPPEELRTTFKSLSAQSDEGHVIQVFDPAELSLPYQGRYIFKDPGNGTEQIHIQNVGALRKEYIERLNAHVEAIRELCRRYNWTYTQHVTDRKPEDTLFALWSRMNRDRKDARQVHL